MKRRSCNGYFCFRLGVTPIEARLTLQEGTAVLKWRGKYFASPMIIVHSRSMIEGPRIMSAAKTQDGYRIAQSVESLHGWVLVGHFVSVISELMLKFDRTSIRWHCANDILLPGKPTVFAWSMLWSERSGKGNRCWYSENAVYWRKGQEILRWRSRAQ